MKKIDEWNKYLSDNLNMKEYLRIVNIMKNHYDNRVNYGGDMFDRKITVNESKINILKGRIHAIRTSL